MVVLHGTVSSMKTSKAMRPKSRVENGMSAKLSALKVGSDECVVLETARDYSQYVGASGSLNRRDKMRFTSRGDGDVVRVWRIK